VSRPFRLLALVAIPIVFPHTPLAQPGEAADARYSAADYAAAAELYREAAAQHPDSGRFWYRLGASLYQTGSYAMPLILMISIPLTLIGIMPGFWLLSALSGEPVGGFANPTFFTATAMIGMIALAGIAVRNAILLIEFLHVGLRQGASLREATLQAGAVRTRPILLTAGTSMLAAVPITLDPIFSDTGLALQARPRHRLEAALVQLAIRQASHRASSTNQETRSSKEMPACSAISVTSEVGVMPGGGLTSWT